MVTGQHLQLTAVRFDDGWIEIVMIQEKSCSQLCGTDLLGLAMYIHVSHKLCFSTFNSVMLHEGLKMS